MDANGKKNVFTEVSLSQQQRVLTCNVSSKIPPFSKQRDTQDIELDRVALSSRTQEQKASTVPS